MRTSLYLPARNEAKNLTVLLPKVKDLFSEVIVVNNRSSDDTTRVCTDLGVRVIEDPREENGIGYGYAHQTGMNASTGDIICTMDADETYPVEAFAEMTELLKNDEFDMVSGSRYPTTFGSHTNPLLQLGTWILNQEVRYVHGFRFKDILSGMWCIKKSARAKIDPVAGDWNFSPEIKILAAQNIRFKEFPITQNKRGGSTKQRYIETGLSHARWIWERRPKHI